MKQNNKFNKFRRDNLPEKYASCSCGAKVKLASRKNYPFGQKSRAINSQYYKCGNCGKVRFVNKKQKGGRK
jgi:hypothetical protein